MFGHVLAYRLKCLLRDRELVFWTLLFPLLLTFFYFAWPSYLGTGKIRSVNTVVVDNRAYRQDDRFRRLWSRYQRRKESNVEPDSSR